MSNTVKKYLQGKIYETSPIHGLFVKLDDGRLGIVTPQHVGDIQPDEYTSYFKKDIQYNFVEIKSKFPIPTKKYIQLSFKLCNPNVILNKRRVMPTISHFNNLRTKVQKDLVSDLSKSK
ncbi:MAG: hypothetical protein ACRC4M_03070 [Mycoplasma sp.]